MLTAYHHPVVQLGVLLASLWVLGRVADVLVEAVSQIGDHFGLPDAIVGATLAAAATSAPELGTALVALIEADAPGQQQEPIGLSTVLGSAVFNLALITGVLGVRGHAELDKRGTRRDMTVYLLATLLLAAFLGFMPGHLARQEALLLLLGYGGYLVWLRRDAKLHGAGRSSVGSAQSANRRPAPEHTASRLQAMPGSSGGVGGALARLIWGTAVVAGACHVLVKATILLSGVVAEATAVDDHLMETVVAAIVVAGGTSLPDLFTSLAAYRHGRTSMAVSNAIGSNTFDVLVGLGLPYALLGGRPVGDLVVASAWYLLGLTVVCLLLLWRGHLRRLQGGALLVGYVLFVVLVLGFVLRSSDTLAARRFTASSSSVAS